MDRALDRHARDMTFKLFKLPCGPGLRPQMSFEIQDKRDGTPMGRIYLHPDRMEELGQFLIDSANAYRDEWQRWEELHRL
jgi:hypothetical protein